MSTYFQPETVAWMRERNVMSWSEVAERDAAGYCPSSLNYDGLHLVTDGETCDECGATVRTAQDAADDRDEASAVDLAHGIDGFGEMLQ